MDTNTFIVCSKSLKEFLLDSTICSPVSAQSQRWGSLEGDLLFLLVLFIIHINVEIGTLHWGRDTQAELEKASPHFSYILMI